MLRKNKFRGRTWKGEWVYGMPICLTEECFDEGTFDGIQTNYDSNEDIEPKTLGQSTTTKTKSKILIWEGDKIMWKEKEWEVLWNEDYSGYMINRSMNPHGENDMKRLDCDIAIESVVIGTIYDGKTYNE